MACNRIFPVLLLSVFATAGYLSAQEVDRAIIRRTDAEKRRFVKDYLAAGAPLDTSFWNGEIGDPVTGFAGLVVHFDWAQEATIKEIERLHAQSPRPDDVLYRLAHHLVGSGTIEAFETIRKYYRDHDQYAYYVSQCIYANVKTRTGQPFAVVYRALESDDPVVRAPARAYVALIAEYSQQTPGLEELWAEALVRRYGHAPTDLEILKDPIAEEIRLANPGLSLSTIPRVRALAKRAALK